SFLFSRFSFLLYLDHPLLHSFPTRRSSDLYPLLCRCPCGAPWASVRRVEAGLQTRRPEPGVRTPPPGRQATRCRCPASPGRQIQDRKSTRLNSSHVASSYAVFCLKKKRQL